MRVLILALSILGILVCSDAAKAGPSTTTREQAASVDEAVFTEEATQETEDRIGLDKRKRRDLQRRLTRLGFDTRASGKFDARTRAVITRWQAARDYPKTGFLNPLQHQALLNESASTANASIRDNKSGGNERRARRRGGGGGPVGVIGGVVGGVVGGIFGRR
ncbi:peptidoglycan-binding domain-containing protein [Bradyrhizobium sp. JYMT SZCCT0428]|uniref:peptidoglycan-binding domain-containing protein n=1 Tax=Bradyrhizobium sp. JYMT SZCCT0428 TaxID=2807673 RepID=UPI001BAA7E4F|nr:peptidoglycan-binding domain-containing protein [Bradyrhizobium sp. JYMT SZCCT0428]MBR1151776.1 peptidoglycan-binding protein [Bradyrhizobium sp. JYMT SZCCT0428]